MAEDGASGGEKMDPAEAQHRLELMRSKCQQLAAKINELDMDKNEHRLVLEALSPLDANRKCFRMVGSVIVERTVSEVVPAVTKNMEGIGSTMEKLLETLRAEQKAADEFATKHRLQAQGQASAAPAEGAGEGGAAGVLV